MASNLVRLSDSPSPPSPSISLPPFTSRTMSSTSAAQPATGPKVPAPALEFLDFVNASPDPFNAVATASKRLEAAGFKRLRESEHWDHHLERGGKYYFTRNQSALVAFAVGGKFTPGDGGVHVVGAHTDSPCFKVKPVSKKEKAGYLQVGVETYGGGLWSTWWDRDLGLAGRVIVADSPSASCTSFQSRIVHINRPILRIPNLAIHLNRGANDGYKPNLEDNMVPILGLAQKEVADQLNASASEDSAPSGPVGTPIMTTKHNSTLLSLLAQELSVAPEQIQDFELSLFDTQPSSIGGAHNEFINSARLDNLMSCFCSVKAMIASAAGSDLASSPSIRAICLFDNEEVGSVSNHGAESNMLPSLIRRLAAIRVGEGSATREISGDGFDAAMAKSFLISSDMAHGLHPNYTSSYEAQNSPQINKGVVIKTNYKQRYASTALTAFMVRRWARLAASAEGSNGQEVPLQEFSMRNDMPCGSTIGPALSKMGIKTLDLGIPQLAMHSCREMCGVEDVGHLTRLFESFWANGAEVVSSLEVD